MVLIGAGSAVFTQGLVMDMISQKWDEPWELGLVDIDKTSVDAMGIICKKMVSEKKLDDVIKITCTVDRKEVLSGANFVVTTIGVGGRRAWEKDVFIPREFGIYQPVGDSVAPGGLSRSMRMIPAMVAIAEDVKKFCPNAYFFNYSNPMTTNCIAVQKETGFPIIGLCHGVKNGLNRVAKFADLDEKLLSGYVVGLNHFVICYKLFYDGVDAWPLFKAAIDRKGVGNEIGPISADFVKRYTAYPVSDDRHYSEFLPHYFGKGAYFGKTLGVEAFSFEGTIGHGDDKFKKTLEMAKSPDPLPEEFWNKLHGEHEQLMEIVQSILHDRRQVFDINIPNNGSVPSLPKNAVLERPAVATADGFVPLMMEDFPSIFTGMLSQHIGIAALTVDAALQGNRDLFVEAIWQGGYMESRAKAGEMADRLLQAQKNYNIRF